MIFDPVLEITSRDGESLSVTVTDGFSDQEMYDHQMDSIANEHLLGDDIKSVYEFDYVDYFPISKLNNIEFDNDVVLAGSYIASAIVNSTNPKDIDVYFKSKKQAEDFIKYNSPNKYKHDLLTDYENCYYLDIPPFGIPLNLVWCVPFKSAEDLVAGFDIRACGCAFTPSKKQLCFLSGAIGDIINRRIVYNTGMRNTSINRLLKYVKKGFSISARQRAILSEMIKNGKHDHDLEINTGAY